MEVLKITKKQLEQIKDIALNYYTNSKIEGLSGDEYLARCWIEAIEHVVPFAVKVEFPEVLGYISNDDE